MSERPSAQEKLRAVINGAHAIMSHKTFEGAARAIFDYWCELSGATAGYVALLSEDGQENEVLFLEAGGMPCSVNPELPMPIRGLRATAYETHAPVYDNDFMNSPWVKYMPEGHVALKNVMFAPLNIEGKTVGIVGMANKPSDFTDDDAEIASVFGDLAAIALANSRHMDLLKEKTTSLEEALAQIRTLRGLVPICANCKMVRDDEGYWTMVDVYIQTHTDAQITHALCPDCIRLLYPEEADSVLAELEATAKKKRQ
jgi:hypothetical protein